MAVNQVAIAGNLTKDAVLRMTRTQKPMLGFTVAVNERKRSDTGEWVDAPLFVPCVLFGTRAEKLAQYLLKGTKVAVAGRLHQVSYLKDDERRSYLEVVVDDIEFISRKQDAVAIMVPQPQAEPALTDVARDSYGAANRLASDDGLYDEDVVF